MVEGGRGVGRRQVLVGGSAGIVTVVLPSASASASGEVAPSFSGSLAFSEVSDTGFTVSWSGV
jgi:hypothetical protein